MTDMIANCKNKGNIIFFISDFLMAMINAVINKIIKIIQYIKMSLMQQFKYKLQNSLMISCEIVILVIPLSAATSLNPSLEVKKIVAVNRNSAGI